jgi:hypothetical protein
MIGLKQTLLLLFIGIIPLATVKQSDTAVKVEKMAIPRYPSQSFSSETEGVVKVHLEIRKDGSIKEATVEGVSENLQDISIKGIGESALLSFASTAAWEWRF